MKKNDMKNIRQKAILAAGLNYTFDEIAKLIDKDRTTIYSILGFKYFKNDIIHMIEELKQIDNNKDIKLKIIYYIKENLKNVKSLIEKLIEYENEKNRRLYKKIQL